MKHPPNRHSTEAVSEPPIIDPLFKTLGALTQREEEQLSRTFCACFNHSQAFQALVFQVLAAHCSLPFFKAASDGWHCDVEVPTKDGKGRIDIRLRPVGDRGNRKTICIESKVRAPDRLKQLERYIDQKMGTVILLTKQRPKIGEPELKAKKVRHVRWQDLHDAFSNANGIKGKDRFLVEEFCHYLEDLGMASESKVTKKDVQEIGRVLTVIGTRIERSVMPRRGLDAASRWMNLMAEVAERVKEANVNLASARQWGPSYYSWQNRDDEPKHQSLGVSFFARDGKWKREFAFYLCITPKKSAQFEVLHRHGDEQETEDWEKYSASALIRNGYFDVDTLTTKVLDLAEQWKVELK